MLRNRVRTNYTYRALLEEGEDIPILAVHWTDAKGRERLTVGLLVERWRTIDRAGFTLARSISKMKSRMEFVDTQGIDDAKVTKTEPVALFRL